MKISKENGLISAREQAEETQMLREKTLRPNVHVLGLHKKIQQGNSWKPFLSNGDNQNILIALFVETTRNVLKSLENIDCWKYII